MSSRDGAAQPIELALASPGRRHRRDVARVQRRQTRPRASVGRRALSGSRCRSPRSLFLRETIYFIKFSWKFRIADCCWPYNELNNNHATSGFFFIPCR